MAGCFRLSVFRGFSADADLQEAVLMANERLLGGLSSSPKLSKTTCDEDTGAPVELTSVSYIWLHISRYGELRHPSTLEKPNCLFRVRGYPASQTSARAVSQTSSSASAVALIGNVPHLFYELEFHATEDLPLSGEMAHALVRTEVRMNSHMADALVLHRRAQWAIYSVRGPWYKRYLLNQAYQHTLKTAFYTVAELVFGFIVENDTMRPTKRFPLQSASLIDSTGLIVQGGSDDDDAL